MANRAYMHNKKNHAEGSSLLVAMIVMGILMTLSLGVSNLLIGTLRDSRMLMEKTKAWYAAESGIERAMLAIYKNPPGFEGDNFEDNVANDARYKYKINATTKEIPLREPYERDKYATLGLNESVTIPLFKGTAPEDSVKKFHVNYYLDPDLKVHGPVVEGLDILRWKIFGITADKRMEVINEFVPAKEGSSADSPTCIGTAPGCTAETGYTGAKFYKRGVDGSIDIEPVHPIETFLNNHIQNFLVLTNIVNIDLIAGFPEEAAKKNAANIKYHVVDDDDAENSSFTLPNIKIESDGFSGETKQSLDLEVKRDTFLPVFNYALYRTVE